MSNGFDDPHKKIDQLISDTKPSVEGKSKQVKKIYDNLKFQKDVEENPIMVDKTYRCFGKNISLSKYLKMRIFPRSIYDTDKLMRLAVTAKYELLKKYISKKRVVPMNMIFILLILVGVIIAVLVVAFLLPNYL